MDLLLIGVGLLAASGLLALLAGRVPRLANGIGLLGALSGAVVGLLPAFGTLVTGRVTRLRLPWDVPYGSFTIELDRLSAFFVVLVLGLAALAAIYASEYLLQYQHRKWLGPPWFFFNLMTASMVLVAVAGNGVLFLVAWEVMSLSSYFLVTFDDEREEVREAGKTYLIATHLGTTFLLVLFVLLGRSAHGSLEFDQFAAHVPPHLASLLFVLAVIGFGTKAGLMPLHVWLPEAYPVAPSFVSAVMSGAMSKLGIYGLLRTLSFMPVVPQWWGWLLVGIGAVSGFYGILTGLAQHDLKRLLAYSSIENMGIIALGLGLGLLGLSHGNDAIMVLGFVGALLHVANHSLFKGLLFLAAGAVCQSVGTRQLDQLGGLSKRMPGLAIAFLLGTLGIIGLPPLNGFISEFLIYSAAFVTEVQLDTSGAVAGLWTIGSLALIGGLAAVGFSNLYGITFLGEPRTEAAARAQPPGPWMTAPIYVLAGGCVLVGLCAPRIVPTLVPIAAQIAQDDPAALALEAQRVLAPVSSISLAAIWLLAVLTGLAVLRKALLWGRSVEKSGTWGCGYTRPTARMQYTGSSYVQPAIDFFAPLLLTRKQETPASGLFPQAASVSTTTPDASREMIYRPLFAVISWVFVRMRWLQQGRVHVYILYVGLTIIALLTWYVSVGAD